MSVHASDASRQAEVLLDKSITVTNKTGWMRKSVEQGKEASIVEVSFLINKHGGFCNFLHSSLLIWENGYNEDHKYIPADSDRRR
jgi:hypothetical protein